MSDRKTTVYIPSGVDEVIEGGQRETHATPEVPPLSQSELIRLLLIDATGRLIDGELKLHDDSDVAVDPEELKELIPEHKVAKYRYKQLKETNWIDDMAGGWRDRVRDRLEKRFRSDYQPEDVQALAEGYIAEAELWFGELRGDEERLEREIQWIHERVREYAEIYEVSNYDADAEFLESFRGVEEGVAESELNEIEDEVRALIVRKYETSSPGRREVAEHIAFVFDVEVEAVLDIVDEVRREHTIADQQRAEHNRRVETPALDSDGNVHDAHAELEVGADELANDGRTVSEDEAEIYQTEAEADD